MYNMWESTKSRDVLGVSLAIQAGQDVDETNSQGQTCLKIAVENNDMHMIQFLLDQGADPYKFDKYRHNSFFWAIEKEVYGCFYFLLAYTDSGHPNHVDTLVECLSQAVVNNAVDVVKELILMGAYPLYKTGVEISPFEEAIRHSSSPEMFDCLIKGLHLGTGDKKDFDVGYMVLCSSGSACKDIFKKLLSHGLNINAMGKQNISTFSMLKRHPSLLEQRISLLLELGGVEMIDSEKRKTLLSLLRS